MNILRFILCWLAASLALAAPASAQIDTTPKVAARLVAERGEIAPGGTVTIALVEDIRSGWHTYWRNPGEAGQPTEMQWMLPQGWTAGPIQWPYPKRLPVGPLMNYGFEGSPWLLMTLRAPANAKPGEIVTLKAAADWLVCSETLCVPENATVSLPLSVSATPVAPYTTVAQQFADARAKLPVPSPWTVHFQKGASLDLFVAAPGLAPRAADFFPYTEGFVRGNARQMLGSAQGGIVLRLVPGAKTARTLDGVLVLTSQDGSVQALDVAAVPGVVPQAQFEDRPQIGVAFALLFALLGGVILNLMPCVLPVLAMKALSVASKAHGDRREAAREGLAYGAGAILSFLVLGAAVLALRAGGEAVGWGFQLQDPRACAAFALLMFAVGLNLSGVFELTAAITAGDTLTRKSGAAGAFFTGILAVAVAAPCTAPFMATSIGFALTHGAGVALGVFACLGVGFAAPFVAIGLSPALLRLLPKPGAWMATFKQLLAFPMYGAAAWLVWVTTLEAGTTGLAATLAAFVGFAFAAWAWSASRDARAGRRIAGIILAALGAGIAIGGVTYAGADASTVPATVLTGEPALHGERFTAARLAQLRGQKRPVFVDATASWCITCLVNEKVALSNAAVADAFERTHTAYLVADWTRRDPEITALLEAHNRPGVPLYLYYAPGSADAEVLPQILTQDAVLQAVAGK